MKFHRGCKIFAVRNPCKMSTKFDFLIFVFFPLSPYVIVFYLYILVICNGFGGMKNPKQDFVDIQFIFSKSFRRKLRVFSFVFSPLFSIAKQLLRRGGAAKPFFSLG